VPITPFHFGPGGLLAVATRSSVSFLSFCATNVLIDVESLYNMVTNQPRIHTFFHTYVGATLAAVFVVLAFVPTRWLATRLPDWPILAWRHLPVRAVSLGALLGAWSHVLFDSIMHSDITPLAPFSDANGLLGLIPLRDLHMGCFIAGVVALAWWSMRPDKENDT
jgi:hypothetical protein